MNNILRVNMSSGSFISEQLPESMRLLGGRGLTARLVLEEVPAGCDPLGPENKLIFAAGLLGGSYLSSANRISVGGKSPLTGGIKESNGGGTTALRLAQLGFRALVVEGKPRDSLFYLLVSPKGCELREAPQLKGLGCFEASQLLLRQWGPKAAIALIGPAGENQMNLAGVAHTDQEGMPTRYSARGGLGAVMGSKGLKAIVILPPDKAEDWVSDRRSWQEAAKKYSRLLGTIELTKEIMPKFGTALTMELINGLGGVPTRNFSSGSFEQAAEIGGVKLRQVILERGGEGSPTHACMPGCLVKCSNRYPDELGKLLNTPVEYENLAFLGANIGNGSLDAIAKLNFLCNDIGIDTIETGGALAVAMEAGAARFGDVRAAEGWLEQIRQGRGLGVLLGRGAAATGRALGVSRVAALKNQTVGAYDPRALKVNGVTYATSPMGGDHTAGNGLHLKIDHRDPTGKVELSRMLQLTSAWVDTLGLCTFVRGVHAADPGVIPALVNSRFGSCWTEQDLEDLGKRVIAWELEFNRRAGLKITEAMPKFLTREQLPPFNSVWDIPEAEIAGIWNDLEPKF